jgi:hypothetical protein
LAGLTYREREGGDAEENEGPFSGGIEVVVIQWMIGLLTLKLQVMIAIRSDPPLAQGQTAPQESQLTFFPLFPVPAFSFSFGGNSTWCGDP